MICASESGMKTFRLIALAVAAGTAFSALAQMPTPDDVRAVSRQTSDALKAVSAQRLKEHIGRTKDNTVARHNAVRVAQDLAGGNLPAGATFTWYAVPPLSNIQRLPDQYPVDGKAAAPLRIVACRDEFEPASFELYPFADAQKVVIRPGDLKAEGGAVIKADKVDVKVVKVWYQDGNGWYSYFNDTGLKLCPDLLLNDENLVKVDTEKKANFIRVNLDGRDDYVWISPPPEIDPGFGTASEPVRDAATLQPVSLKAGEFKQFMVTVRVDANAKPGLYRGEIAVASEGAYAAKIPVVLRVLPFLLPQPKTYYDTSADFYSMLYCNPGYDRFFAATGNDAEAAKAKVYRKLKDQFDHNVIYPLYYGLWNGYANLAGVERDLGMAKEIGMRLDPFFEAYSCYGGDKGSRYFEVKRRATIADKEFRRILGHGNIYPAGGEEPGPASVVASRNGWRIAHELGNLVLCNGGDRRHYSGYADDFRVGGGFASKDQADFMHRIKGKIGNYAGPHTGPENPDYMRRMHGLNLYKKDYDMMYNYGYFEGEWNDLRGACYRITLVYETRDGFIDTLPWEGIREGLDDIRYATLLKQLAERAVEEGRQKDVTKYYAGRKALQFLANLDEETCDLPAARLEMINHILALDKLLGGVTK